MSDLKSFFFRGDEIRVFPAPNGEPLFVAKDIAVALDYEWSGNKTVGHIPEEWKVVESVSTTFGQKETICLTEQGLYFFLCRSDKPKARPFQKWLAGIVLPSIRRTGSYSLPTTPPPAPNKPRVSDLLSSLGLSEDVLTLNRSLRVRLLGIAARVALMDPEQESRLFATFGKLCIVATAHRRKEQDESPASRFVRERLVPSRGQIQARKLYEAFTDWCYGMDITPCSMRRFCASLRAFFPVRESNRTYFQCAFVTGNALSVGEADHA